MSRFHVQAESETAAGTASPNAATACAWPPSRPGQASSFANTSLPDLSCARLVWNAVSDAIVVADAVTGILIDANPAACDFIGLARGQLLGRCHTTLHPPEEKALHISLFRECVRSAQARESSPPFPVTVLRADGVRLRSRVTVLVLPHEDRTLVCEIFQSLATLALLDSRLQDSEAYYAQALPNTGEGVWSWNPATKEVFLSTRWKEQLGFGPDEFPHTVDASVERIHPEDAERVLPVLRRCALGEQVSFSFEYRLRHKDGAYRWMHGRGATTRDASGRVICLAGANSDITERKEAELALRESEQRFRLLARNTPDAVFLHDMTGRVLEGNDRACELLGYAMEELRRLNVTDFESSCPPETLCALWKDLKPGPFSFEGLARRKDGTTFPTEVQGVAFAERGRILALVAARDLTARKAIEGTLAEARDAARAASRAKTEFLASMSHEIRTPMNIILGMADLLRETAVSPTQQAYLQAIENSGRVLLGLINDILDLSQIEANKIELRLETFAPATVIEDVCAGMGMQARQKGLSLTVRLAEDLPRTVRNDPARLRQVLMNLICNAVKFTTTGSIEVTASGGADAAGRDVARVDVADTGCGILREELDTVFQAFTQASPGPGFRPAGTGLGLAICKQLVERMGGEIGVTSEPGKGSLFYFTLPSIPGPETVSPRPSAKETAPPLPPLPAQPLRLLLAEDSESNRELIRLFLQSEPYEIVVAETGREAVDLFTAAPFDLVLMDMEMPQMDGCEATEAIRRLEARTGRARTPVLMLSAHAFAEYEEEGRRAGCDGFMSKPIPRATLVRTLREALAARAVAEPA